MPLEKDLMRPVIAFALCLLVVQAQPATVQAPFDVVIVNGHVVDGTGSPWYAADVGIRDGRIARAIQTCCGALAATRGGATAHL